MVSCQLNLKALLETEEILQKGTFYKYIYLLAFKSYYLVFKILESALDLILEIFYKTKSKTTLSVTTSYLKERKREKQYFIFLVTHFIYLDCKRCRTKELEHV